jgi:O-antigen/teichoic acid export membrane protein
MFNPLDILKSSVLMALLKVVNLILSLSIIKIVLEILSADDFAYWILFSSLFLICGVLDFGIVQTTRNILASKYSKDNKRLMFQIFNYNFSLLKKYQSILAAFFFIIVISLYSLGHINIKFVIPLSILLIIGVLTNMFKLVYSWNNANGKPEINSFLNFISLLSSFIVFNFYSQHLTTLVGVVLVFYGIPLLYLITYWFIFLRKTNSLVLKKTNLSLACNFFILQMLGIAILETLPFFLKILTDSKTLTDFYLSYKLFSLLIIGYSVVLTPVWSAITYHASNYNFRQLKKIYIKTLQSSFLVIILSIIFYLNIDVLLTFFGDSNYYNGEIAFTQFLFVSFYVLNMSHIYIFNGLSLLKIQRKVDLLSISFYLFTVFLVYINLLEIRHLFWSLPLSQLFGIIIYPLNIRKHVFK